MTGTLVMGSTLAEVGGATAWGCLVLGTWFVVARERVNRRRVERQGNERAREAEAAAVEASLTDAVFAPDEVRAAVSALLNRAVQVWDGEAESTCEGEVLIERWAESLAAWLGEGVHLIRKPSVDLLQVINRPGETEDRVVVRLRLSLRGAHRTSGQQRDTRIEQRWTLARKHQAWTLGAIDADPLSPSILSQGSIPADWADRERLRETSFAELADADSVDPRTDLSGLVSPDAMPAQQLIELAQIDGRFNPDLIESRIAHIVDAWEQACTGSHSPLAALTSPAALNRLLYLSRRNGKDRLVVRDTVLTRWTPEMIDPSSKSPRIDISLTVSAVRYLATANGRHLQGSREARHLIHLKWTLTLDRAQPSGWQLTKTTSPAEALPAHSNPPGL
jgi:hypothetical protein